MHDSFFNPLFAYWRHSWIAANLDSDSCESAFQQVEYCYNAPSRYYHKLDHLLQFLKQAERLMPKMYMTPAFVLACFWHDLVYDTTRCDNEEESAAIAEQVLRSAAASEPLIESISTLILATKRHIPSEGDLNTVSAYFVDCDISILAAQPGSYKAYAKAIRAEYGSLNDAQFREGRSKFLKKMLAREHLFFTEPFRMTLESQARANMIDELNELEPVS